MGLQWSMRTVRLSQDEELEQVLRDGYEPFAAAKEDDDEVEPSVFFKKQFFAEDDEPRSSTKEENRNWAGTQTTE